MSCGLMAAAGPADDAGAEVGGAGDECAATADEVAREVAAVVDGVLDGSAEEEDAAEWAADEVRVGSGDEVRLAARDGLGDALARTTEAHSVRG
jgi:hypothetical protein